MINLPQFVLDWPCTISESHHSFFDAVEGDEPVVIIRGRYETDKGALIVLSYVDEEIALDPTFITTKQSVIDKMREEAYDEYKYWTPIRIQWSRLINGIKCRWRHWRLVRRYDL